jgi:hypothetical protein
VFLHARDCGVRTDQYTRRLLERNYPVVTIDHDALLVNAFVRIYRTGVSGIGVTDREGHLVGSISASDLKLIGTVMYHIMVLQTGIAINFVSWCGAGYSGAMFRKLFVPIKDWLAVKSQGTTVWRFEFIRVGLRL